MSKLCQFKAKKTTEESQKDEKSLWVSGSLLSTVFVSFYRKKTAGLDLD